MKKFIVLFAVLAMVFGITATAVADMSPYGSIRFRTYTVGTDKEFAGTGTTPFDTRSTDWSMGILSRIGFKFETGDVGGLWEFDTGFAASTTNGVALSGSDSMRWGDFRVRHAYGYWNFGSGQLLIGQTWPLSDLNAGVVYYTGNLDQGYGSLGLQDARPMQLRLTFGNLKIAFISPYTNQSGIYNDGTSTASATDVTLPKIEVGYTLKMENISMDFVGGYQTYEDRIVSNDKTEDLDAYLIGFRVKANFGGFHGALVAGYAQNARQYGMEYTDQTTSQAVWFNNAMHDAEAYNVAIALGYKFSDTMDFEVGYAMVDSENDSNGATKYEDTSYGYHANLKIKLADNVYVIPEVVVIDRDDTTWGRTTALQQGKQTIAGVFWMINFK